MRVRGVRALWREDGAYLDLDDEDPFSASKLEGASTLAAAWSKPCICVGDGMTDYALLEGGLVERFFHYTEHVRREAVAAKAVDEVDSMLALRGRLQELL